MSRALIIKNANFSVNKLGTITITEEVPCTGITINSASLTLTAIGLTATLTATPTPSDTTDTVVWSTSDSDVVAVAGGTVTATGCGTATITVTCGAYTASCEVSVSHIATVSYVINTYCAKDDNKDFLTGGKLTDYAVGYAESGGLYISNGIPYKYPVLIPNGANKIEINSQNFRPYGFWVNSKRNSAMSGYVFAYASDSNFAYSADISNYRTVTIPDRTSGTYEGVDAAAFVFRYMGGTITQEIADTISIKFTA